MVLVPAGSFEMGGEADVSMAECELLYVGGTCEHHWFTDQEPLHTVTLEDFYIDQYEVTNDRYNECVDAGACAPPAELDNFTRQNYFRNPAYGEFPVVNVTWADALSLIHI